MKAVQINNYGGNEVIEINNDAPRPVLQPGFVLVQLKAAGVNPSDWKIRQGLFSSWLSLKFPATLGGDFAGVVHEVSNNVSGFKVGDEVYGRALASVGGSGAFAEFVLTDVNMVAAKPETMDFLQAAGLPLVGASAYQALIHHMGLAKGQTILIHGAAGGIGSIAVQIAKHLGAFVIGTAAGKDQEFVKSLGADRVINYEKQNFTKVVPVVDFVFDTVGGETFDKSVGVIKSDGIIVTMSTPAREPTNSVRVVAQQTKVTNDILNKLKRLAEAGVIRTHIDKVFSLDQAASALDYLRNDQPQGKVVIDIKGENLPQV